MGSDMLVALQEVVATGQGTLFGINRHSPRGRRHVLRLIHGGSHEDEAIAPIPANEMLQTRPVCTVLGLQEAGNWGFDFGCNEHNLAIGAVPWRSRLVCADKGLTGADLVRITLERSHSCTQAVETIAGLIARYGQRAADADGPADSVFLIADGREAYVIEAAGNHWAMLECTRSRVVTDVGLIQQDWHRLSPGLAAWAIEQSLWVDDGSKLDFLGAVGSNTPAQSHARRRWGRASIALAQQEGAIDHHFLRRMLGDHYLTSRALLPDGATLAASFLAGLACDAEPLAWLAYGPPRVSLFFPIALAGELPLQFSADHPENPGVEQLVQQLAEIRDDELSNRREAALTRLQERFDRDAEVFQAQAASLRRQRNTGPIRHLATSMMHQHVKWFEAECRGLCSPERADSPIEESAEMVPFAF